MLGRNGFYQSKYLNEFFIDPIIFILKIQSGIKAFLVIPKGML
jgi:hypothetical protein